MNSEELEQSLRTEFENYLNGVLTDIKQDVANFQTKIEAEVEKHRSQLDEAFRDFSDRLSTDKFVDHAFKESVVEHLRLARDEGAEIAATAMAQAEDMDRGGARRNGSSDSIRSAVRSISSKRTQPAILGELVKHASQFTSHGAFFIVKNDRFVGWRSFDGSGETPIDVNFAADSGSLLSSAVRSLETETGTAVSDDSVYLDALKINAPESMYAIPLVARGRGVAVLFAEGGNVDVDALETLVRVAGLTVELAAASTAVTPAQPEQRHDAPAAEPAIETVQEDHFSTPTAEYFDAVPTEEYQAAYEPTPAGEFEFTPLTEETATPYAEVEMAEAEPEAIFEPVEEVAVEEEPVPVEFESYTESGSSWNDTVESSPAFDQQETYSFEPAFEPAAEKEEFPADEIVYTDGETEEAVQFETEPARFDSSPVHFESEPAQFDSSPMEPVVPEYSDTANGNGSHYEVQPTVEVSASQPTRSGLGSRPVDLPIEVGEEERSLHQGARRFARLLVSEIKLYNQDKVKEGRESNDLYERLREAIDRSREMYDRRVEPPVASKFDYFHYELVSDLAEGDASRLGGSYPGSTAH